MVPQSRPTGLHLAQYNLGNLYRDGKGVPQNAYIARDWQEKAAAQGDRDAMYALGSLYRQGALGISGDGQHALAFYWLEQAAMRGHPQAQAELAGLYARGEGVVRNPAIAAKWQRAAATAQTGTENTDNSGLTAIEQTEQAAMHGDTQAQIALANHYALGDGIARDVEAALKWWQVAAAQGSTDAMQALARHYRDAADRPQAEHWYLAAAEKGDSSAYRELGQIYADARPPDYTTARKYWHAGKKGDPVAQYLIGKSHSDWREPGNPNAAHNAFSGFLQHCHEDENPPADYCADAAYLTALIEQHKLPGYQPPQPNEVRQHWQEAAYWGHPVARAWLETAPAPPGAPPPRTHRRHRGGRPIPALLALRHGRRHRPKPRQRQPLAAAGGTKRPCRRPILAGQPLLRRHGRQRARRNHRPLLAGTSRNAGRSRPAKTNRHDLP